ncbi:MAG: hypothetical protein LBR52_05250 [Prevotellaceae bacterium]|jgi:hypothetical protein|nr:hypothetical protein [Prevotellaceae bacterium]
MWKFNFSIKRILFLIIFTVILTGCFRINHQTLLKLKDGSNVLLYQHDSVWMEIWGSMKEWNNYIIFNDNQLIDSNYVKLSIRLNNLDTVFIDKFHIRLCYIKDGILKEITEGKLYYDPESYRFNDYHLYYNMIDTFTNYEFVNPSYGFGTLLVVQSEPSIEIGQADNFVVDMFLDCIIDREAIIIHKIDTLYRNKKTKKGFSVH